MKATDVQQLVANELSRVSRVGHVVLLLVTLTVVAAASSLWLTEVGLPLRTHLAFAAVVAINASWAGYATWVLRTRQLVFDTHRVVAARMALGFSVFFVVASLALAVTASSGSAPFRTAALAAGGCGGVMCVIAMVFLRQATRRVAALKVRRNLLDQQTRGIK